MTTVVLALLAVVVALLVVLLLRRPAGSAENQLLQQQLVELRGRLDALAAAQQELPRALADGRAAQLREHSGFANAGVYDPPGVGGTHVIYVLHDATHPEQYGGLPADPRVPPTFSMWKPVAKPIGLLLALLAAPVAFFHYVTAGPKEPQPEPPGTEVPR